MTRNPYPWLGIVAAIGVGIAVWELTAGGSPARASERTVAVTRGNIVVTVGGVGKVVAGGTPATPATSATAATAGGNATAPSLGGLGRLVYPQVAGHVLTVTVTPGQRVKTGQVLARLDPGAARTSLVGAQAALDQATAQLALDRTGVTQQTLASAQAAVVPAGAVRAAAAQTLAHALGVNRAAVAAARLQVAQTGSNQQSVAAAKASVGAARQSLAAARSGLADVRDANARQQETLQHAVDSARRDLAADQSRLQRDLVTERSFCGTTSPVVGTDTAPECANAVNTVNADQQAISKDQTALQAADDALAQGALGARQSEHQAAAQVAAATQALRAARDQLAGAYTTTRQARATARSALAEALSKAADGMAQARGQLRAAVIGVANARAALAALRRGGPAALLAQDRSKIAASQAQVVAAEVGLEQTVVRSPVAGTVTWVFATPGGSADLTTPIAAVADLAHLVVSVDLSEFDAARVRTGMGAVVSVDALGGKRFPGRVEFEALAGVDNGGVVTFPVRVRLRRATGVKPGMNVSVRVIVEHRDHVLRVPVEAVTRDGRTGTVTVVDASGRHHPRSVALGLSDNKYVEVHTGLRPGERLLLAGASEGV